MHQRGSPTRLAHAHSIEQIGSKSVLWATFHHVFLLSKNGVDLSSLLGHDKLTAVKQQRELFSELRDKFARRLTNHLNNVFIHQVTC